MTLTICQDRLDLWMSSGAVVQTILDAVTEAAATRSVLFGREQVQVTLAQLKSPGTLEGSRAQLERISRQARSDASD